jgi:hypothetical protein
MRPEVVFQKKFTKFTKTCGITFPVHNRIHGLHQSVANMEDDEEVARLQTKLAALKQESMLMLQEEQRLKIVQRELEVKRLQEAMESQVNRERRKQQRAERQERRKEIFGDDDTSGLHGGGDDYRPSTSSNDASALLYGPDSALHSPLPNDEPRCLPLSHDFKAHPSRDIIFCAKCGRIENLS